MRIGIDARPLCNPRTAGVHIYVKQVLTELIRAHPEDEYVLFSHRRLPEGIAPGPVEQHAGRGILPGTIWMNLILPGLLRRTGIDVVWGPWQYSTSSRCSRN